MQILGNFPHFGLVKENGIEGISVFTIMGLKRKVNGWVLVGKREEVEEKE